MAKNILFTCFFVSFPYTLCKKYATNLCLNLQYLKKEVDFYFIKTDLLFFFNIHEFKKKLKQNRRMYIKFKIEYSLKETMSRIVLY